MTTKEFNSSICSTNEKSRTQFDGNTGKTWLDEENVLTFKADISGATGTVEFEANADSPILPLCALEALFCLNNDLKKVTVKNASADLKGYFHEHETDLEIPRSSFFQLPLLWHFQNTLTVTPERWTTTKDVAHPVRPRVHADQVVYKRFIPSINKTLSFRVAHPDRDIDVFHDWQNQERVAKFWEMNKSKEELKEYLIKGLQDPHQFPVILELDEVPVGYFEMYWVKENRLGPYYDSEVYDRSFHVLIGNPAYLGFANTDAVLKAVTHYLFLDEPRTRKLMAEPRSDNTAMLKYVETFKAWKKLKEFDFPHKRAALLEVKREAFFLGDYL